MLRGVKGLISLGSIMAALGVALLAPGLTAAAEYPEDRIRFVIPFGPGGGSDAVALRSQKAAANYIKLPMEIIYMPGGSGVVGAKYVSQADPKYPLPLLVSLAKFITLPPSEAGYTADDFEWIAQIGLMPMAIVAPPNSTFDFAGVVKQSNDNPDSLSAGVLLGGGAEIISEMLENKAGAKLKRVPYNGVGEIMLAVMGGHIDIGIVSLSTAVDAHKAKTARMIAVSHEARLPNVPDVPTMSEVVGADMEFSLARAIFAQKGISAEAKTYLEDVFEKVVSDPTYVAETEKRGEVPAFRKGNDLKIFLNKRFEVLRPFYKELAAREKN